MVALSLAAILQPSSSEALFIQMNRFTGSRRVSTTPASALRASGGGTDDEVSSTSMPLEPVSSDTPQDVQEQGIPSPPTIIQGPKAKPPGRLRRKFPRFPFHKLPDYLTYMRCAAIPLLCLVFYSPGRNIESGSLFAVASLTDYLDGFLARRWDISTAFGAFLDPVADKLMVSTALILLAGRHGAIVAVPSCIILARELAVSALREWMAQRGQRDSVKVGFQGKLKTALTMIALTLMLLVPDVGQQDAATSWLGNLFLPSLVSLYACTIITVTSGSVYFRAAAPLLLQK